MIRELKNVYIDVPDIPMSPLSTCFDKRLKPKKVKTSSIDIQTTESFREIKNLNTKYFGSKQNDPTL